MPKDAIDLLTEDHRKVEKLFMKAQNGRGGTAFTSIVQELQIHTAIEEKIFYPAVRKALRDTAMINEAKHEHAEVKKLLPKVQRGDRDALQQVIAGVTHHVQEEESEMFPMTREHMDAAKLAQLGRQLTQMKRERRAAMMEKASRATKATRQTRGTSGPRRSTPRGRAGAKGTLGDMSKAELMERARDANITGRSGMDKRQLVRALQRAR